MQNIKRVFENNKMVFSLIILIPVLFIALFGPALAPHDPLEINSTNTFAPSSAEFPLGTDEYGRCILSRLLVGIRPSIIVAFLGSLGALIIGSLWGMIAGYSSEKVSALMMRSIEMILSFPPILLAMLVVALWGKGVRNLIIVVIILYTPHFARIAHSSTLKVKNMEYVENAVSVGASRGWILLRSILPNITSPLIIQTSLTISNAILLESGLSFLGLGVVAPHPSWGKMIGDARQFLSITVMYTFWPSFFLLLTILATNMFGDALRDILDPKLRQSF